MPQQQRNVQLEPTATHGPVSGPVNGALVALALTMVIWASQRIGDALPVWLPLAIAMAGSAAATAVTMIKDSSIPNLCFRIACWMGGGAWSFIALTTAYDRIDRFILMLIGLIVGGVLAFMFLPVFAKPIEEAKPELPLGVVNTPIGKQDNWTRALEHLIAKLLALKTEQEQVHVFRTTSWPNNSGATFQVEFSAGSSRGLRDIQDIQVRLQQALRLEDGCTISAKRAGRQGTTLIDVMFFNDMATVYPMPRDFQQRSGLDKFPLGLYGDKTCCMVTVYQDSAIVTGIRGGGKTVLMNSINVWLMQCIDVVIWHADLNGGAMSAPWMYLTATGQVQGTPVDWVAHSAEEMLYMAEAAERIAKKRKTAYASLLSRMKTDKLPISAQVPMLLVMVDEGGEAFGDDVDEIAFAASKKFQAVQRIGRAMCVNVIFTSQRATAEYIPAKMKKLANIKVSLRVDDDAELAHLFDWNKGLSSDDLMYPGCAFVKIGGEITIPRMIKTYWTQVEDIEACVVATVGWRPKLDKISADEAGPIYAERWDRAGTRAWMASIGGGDDGIAEYSAGPAPTATALLDRAHEEVPFGLDRGTLSNLQAHLDATDQVHPDRMTGGPGGGSTPPTGGAHDRQAMVQRRVDQMDPAEVQKRAEQLLSGVWDEKPPAALTPPPAAPAGPAETAGPAGGGEPPAEPAVGEVSEQDGVEWVYTFIDGHGTTPVKTKTIRDAVFTAGLTTRPNTPSEWIAKLVTDERVVQVKYAHYVSDRNKPNRTIQGG